MRRAVLDACRCLGSGVRGLEAVPLTPWPYISMLEVRSAAGAVRVIGGHHEWMSGERGHCEDWSRHRTVAGELRLHAVEEVESKEWGQEDTSRRYPQGPGVRRWLEFEPRMGGNEYAVTPVIFNPVFK